MVLSKRWMKIINLQAILTTSNAQPATISNANYAVPTRVYLDLTLKIIVLIAKIKNINV